MILTLDTVAYDHKPHGIEVSAITRRMQRAGAVEAEPWEVAQLIAAGVTWCGGCFEPSGKGWGKWQAQQLFALDFDNSRDGKPLMPSDDKYLDPWAALGRWNCIFGTFPIIMYPSFSFRFGGTVADLESPDTRMKYRCILATPEPITDPLKAASIRKSLLELFPEADSACSNPNRLFFGSGSMAAWWDAEGVAHYVK